MNKSVLFDLDGTLTDSAEGIINSVIFALKRFGIPVPQREKLRVFVGPPLADTFIKFGVPKEKASEAVEVYRERYVPIGIYENRPYDGVKELLQKLKDDGYRLFVATSKPESMAISVLERFELTEYFEAVCGATLDGSRCKKADVIAYLKERYGDIGDTLMVGDTASDVKGAAVHGIKTVGVTWGYGLKEEMLKAGATLFADTPKELYEIIKKTI